MDHADHFGSGSSASETLSVTAPNVAGTYNTYISVSSNDSCTGTLTTTTLANSITVAAPTLKKVSSAASAGVGDTITFKITATNPLSIPLNNVTVTDTLPTGMSYVADVTSLGSTTTSGQIVTWNIPSIPGSSSAQMTLVVTVNQKGTLVNSVTTAGLSTPVTASVVVLESVVTHFRMDEAASSWKGTAGEVLDSGTTSLSARRVTTSTPTTTNAVAPNPTIESSNSSVVGSFCNAGNFDGKAYIQVPHTTDVEYKQQLSATAWIYPKAYPTGSGGNDLNTILSNDQNYEFHLNPSGKLFWWWNASSLTSNTTIPLNKWTHVAITLNSSSGVRRQRIYINGVLDSNVGNWQGTLSSNPCDFFIGGDIATDGQCSLLSSRSFKGMIDEVKLYKSELTASEIVADMTLGRTCSGDFDHIRIEHDGNGSICYPETVTIKACMDSSCTRLYPGKVTVTLSSTGWSSNPISFTNGSTTQTLTIGSSQTYTLGTDSVSPTPSNQTRCFNGSTETCTLTFASASCNFDAVETSAPPRTRIFTKLSGTNFNLDLLALTSSSTVNTTYKGSVTVDLVDASSSSCPTTAALGSAQTVTFANSDKGRKNVSFDLSRYSGGSSTAAAARNVRVRMTAGSSAPACSTDNFAIRPSQFAISSSMTNSTLTGTPKATAGTAFTLTANSGVSGGYSGTPLLDTGKVYDHNGTAIATGTLSGSFNAATGISAVGNSFKYLDVGNIQLDKDAVIDSSFTGVDQTSDCIADSTSNSLASGKYGCNIGSASSAKFGRWYPSHYSFAGTLTPFCKSTNFTYMGQDQLAASLVLKAHASTGATASASDPVTSRYTSGYTNLAGVTFTGDNNGTSVATSRLTSPNLPTMPNTALWANGIFTLSDTYVFSRLASPDGPYDSFKLIATISDPDGSALIGTATQKATNTTSLRHGRLWIGNAYGSEMLDLAIPFEAQYWTSGGYYATNRSDSCTNFNVSSIMLSNFSENLAACETQLSPIGTQTLSGGKLKLKLTRPGLDASNVPNRGSVLLTLNTGSTASGTTCVTSSSSSATAASIPWFGSNPSGKATFGISRSPYIYYRENF
ncbi:DUF6701 domain-containing protein [Azonexus sp. IMCC34839]|uniref:DUF6701 domain-containing protein n=1 Tax=Azonexus sp. IMCC34839 TaxID=3133695 RepID=UPI00399A9389